MDGATRQIFWQIENRWIFYVLALASLLILGWGVLRAARFVHRGAAPPQTPTRRMGFLFGMIEILSHGKLKAEKSARAWHLLVFYGFSVLFFVTCYLMLSHYGLMELFVGMPYLLVSLIADLAGVGLLAGACMALVETRHLSPDERTRKPERSLAFSLLGLVCLSGFLVEGVRIFLEDDPWRAWSPAGTLFSFLFRPLGEPVVRYLFRPLWWVHSALALGLVAWIPFSSRFRHMFFLPVHRPLEPLHPRSVPAPVDLQVLRLCGASPGSVRLGIETASETTREQRLGMLACMDCGRCETLCPAFQTGQPLSPRRVLQDLRGNVMCRRERVHPSPESAQIRPADAVTPASLWACRLCRACEERCPAGIGHVAQILEMRRAEVMGRGRLPDEGALALRNLARTGSPYGVSPAERTSWCQQHQVPDRPQEAGGSWLLWTGCFSPGDEQRPRVLSALVSLLRELGISFFAPQDLTSCCGDPARILGDEDLFQTMAARQIHAIKQAGANKILVHCPHCYTVLKDVYPLFGADLSVLHTSELFLDAMRKGCFQMKGCSRETPIVYHDPCFLGRYQDLYEPPRSILSLLPGVQVLDPPRTRREGFCCGGGGGHFFMDLDVQERPSSNRLREIRTQPAEVLSVSCSFCFAMFDDALRRLSDPDPVRVADWLELLREAVTFEALPPDRSVFPASKW